MCCWTRDLLESIYFAVVEKAVGCALSLFLSFNWTLGISLLLSKVLIESFLWVWSDYSVCFTMSRRSGAGSSSVIQHLVILFHIQWSYEMSKFTSGTSNSQERMFDFQINIKFPVKLITSLPNHQQSLSLGTIPIDNCVSHCSSDKIIGSLL